MKRGIFASAVRRLKSDSGAWLLIIPALLCIYFSIIRPQLLAFIWSFCSMKGYTITGFAGLDNFKVVLTDTLFLKTFFNTLKYVMYSAVIGFIPPIIVALIMNELIHFRKIIRVIIYLPSIMPAVAVSLLWYFMYYPDQTGLLNVLIIKLGGNPYTWLQDGRFTILYIVVSMAWSASGATVIYYFSALQGINRELYEAAVMDGAGVLYRLRVVTLPYMSGILLLFFVRHLIGVFNIMEQPMQMTNGGPNNASVTLGLLNYRYAFEDGHPQYALALSVIMFIFGLIATVGYFRLNKKVEENR
ncbi:MAG: sugar ABC transporter permease [Clostridia bacterium]|nr:sugar ABC transporter permease [Clostridia bacterium]